MATATTADPDWYDAVWLNAYYAAKDLVARTSPARLEEFVRAFDPLRTAPVFTARHLAGAIEPGLLKRLRSIVRAIPRETFEFHEMQRFGRLVVHDHPAIDAVQAELTDQVSTWAGERVEPSYNFISLYTRLGRCEPHLDAPSAKWTLDPSRSALPPVFALRPFAIVLRSSGPSLRQIVQVRCARRRHAHAAIEDGVIPRGKANGAVQQSINLLSLSLQWWSENGI